MTNDLAIKILMGDVLGTTEQAHEAITMAVKALSARTDTDTISRRVAIDALERRKDKTAKGEIGSFYNTIIQHDIDVIVELPSAQPESRWIPCSERLPAKKTEVIYTLDNHYVSTGYMNDRDYNGDEMELHWEDMESGALIYPEAWMPLPEPWNGEQHE